MSMSRAVMPRYASQHGDRLCVQENAAPRQEQCDSGGAGNIALKLRDFTGKQIASRAPRGLRLPERDPLLIRPW